MVDPDAEKITEILERRRGKAPDPDEDLPYTDEETKKSYDRGRLDFSGAAEREALARHGADLPPSTIDKIYRGIKARGGNALDWETELKEAAAAGTSNYGEDDAAVLPDKDLLDKYGEGRMSAEVYNAEAKKRGLKTLGA